MQEILLFLEIVEKENFAKAHEVLEEVWKKWKQIPSKKEESYILKGLINGATALALIRLGRKEGAMRVWKVYEKYAPLVDKTASSHTALYKRAQKLLEVKYQLLIQ